MCIRDREEALPCGTLILCTGRLPDSTLHDALAAEGLSATRIGDCLAPSSIADAVHSAHRFARRFSLAGLERSTALIEALSDPDSPLRDRIAAQIRSFAEAVRDDEALSQRLDTYVADLASFVVNRYGGEIMTVISHTIERWDGAETAEKVELHVGRDLQFIRINGTIVGGLVGVLIHAVSLLVQR